MVVCILLFFIATLNHQRTRHTTTFHVSIDSSFTEDEKTLIVGAAHRWELATDRAVYFDISEMEERENFNPFLDYLESIKHENAGNRSTFIWKGRSEDPRLILLEMMLGFQVLGFCPGPFIVIVPDRMSDSKLQKITIHELGHLMGLKHTSTIMGSDHEFSSACITPIDMRQFCNVYGCESATKPECINGHL